MKIFKMGFVTVLFVLMMGGVAIGQQWTTNTVGIHYNGGKVGIGTTNPGGGFDDYPTLHINGTRPTISLTSQSSLATIQWKGVSQNSEFHLNFENNSTNSVLRLNSYQAAGMEVFAIRGNGNVGIGTYDPKEKLHVRREPVSNAHYLTTASIFEGAEGKFQIVAREDGSSAAQFLLSSAPNSGENKHWGFHHTGVLWGDRLDIGYGTSTETGNFWNLPSKMSILTNGNVGIGTTSPQEKLHIESGNILVDADGANEKGIYFRQGFTQTSKYNTSIFTYNHKDTYADGISINGYDGISFNTGSNNRNEIMRITFDGNVGIGTTDPQAKLSVDGHIISTEINVKTDISQYPDFVFEEDYNLLPLEKLEQHIKQNKHLPDIPTVEEVEANGIAVGKMQAKLLQKVEELTLYMIELKKENETLKNRVAKLEGE